MHCERSTLVSSHCCVSSLFVFKTIHDSIKSGPDKGAYMREDFVRWEEPYSITSMIKDKKRKNKSKHIETGDALNKDESKHTMVSTCHQSEEIWTDNQKMPPKSKKSLRFEHTGKKQSLRKRDFEVMGSKEQAVFPQSVLEENNETCKYEAKMKHRGPQDTNLNFATGRRSPITNIKDRAKIATDSSILGILSGQSFERNVPVGFSKHSFPYDSENLDATSMHYTRSHYQGFQLQQPMNFQPQSGQFNIVNIGDSNISSSTASFSTTALPKDASTTASYSSTSRSDNNITMKNAMLTNVAMQATVDGNEHSNADSRKSCGDNNIESVTAFGTIFEDMLSPLAIFSPNSHEDIAQGRVSVGASASSIEHQKSSHSNDAAEDVDEEEMNHDLRSYFAELEKSIQKEQEKHAKKG
ncbi:hypothetical protein ACHAXS_001005 [Conticribra weissflogii]